ncbi:AMP-dependent synthetase and ligase [Stanieria sp. NIES-3757]|nr:AMP-dependent synthetase and ligase [Stanieria sp. NIES-3757]
MNITYHIERASKLFPDKTALIFEEKSYTYQELDRLANRMANGLTKLGVTKGDRVALFLPNIPEFIISYLGTLKLGAIAVSLNVMLKSSEVSFILNDCTAKVLVTTEELREQVIKPDIPQLQTILLAEQQIGRGISLDWIIANASPEAEAIDLNKKDPAAIVYTSGTTGFPKGATLSHGNIVSNMAAQNHCCNMTSGDRLLLYLPLFHCFGQNAVLNAGLNVGATIVLQRRFNPEQVLDAILTEKITMFFGVPTVFITLLNLNPSILANVRYFFSAAAPMPVEIAQKWQEQYGIVIHEGYGLTETSPCACYNHNSNYKFGSIGTPIDNVAMKIVDTEGKELPPGEIGEIAIKGSNVMLGYWNRPLETAKVLKNGWFHSGDIGSMDEDGYFYIVDRLKDMINVSGFKVYPAEVENVLYQHPAVAEAAVYGLPDPFKGETVNANIVLKDGYTITETEIAAFCAEKIATYKVPKCFKFVDAIPKNATGKVLKRLLSQNQAVFSQTA